MVVSLMEMLGGLGQGIGSPSFNTGYGTRPPTAFPMPFNMRPPAPGMPDTRSFGEKQGWGDNPIYNALKNPGVSEMLMDLGYGMLNSTNMGDALAAAGNRTLELAPERKEARREEEMRTRYAELIGGWGDEYADFAQGIADGAIDPADGYWKALQFKQSQAEEGADLARDRANAQFLTDPQLRSMVEGGALTFADAYKYERSGGMGDADVSMQPQWFRDPETGEMVLGQMTDNGTIVRTNTDGLLPVSPFELSEARAAGTTYGKGTGQAAIDLPSVEAQTEFAINNLNNLIYQTGPDGQVMTNPQGNPVPNVGMQEQFGKGWMGLPTGQTYPAFPGSEKANFQARREQVQGQAFLQAIDSLKGSGAVSEAEGLKATQAIIRAQTSQTEEEFVKSIQEAITIYQRGLENARNLAGAGSAPRPSVPGVGGGGGQTPSGLTWQVE